MAPASFSGKKWRISVDGGDDPRWSPDGRELFYLQGARLMAAPISAEGGFTPGRPDPLPATSFTFISGYDIAPDGKRFIVVGRIDEEKGKDASSSAGWRSTLTVLSVLGVQEIRVVVNWFDEIRKAATRSGS